MLFSPELIDESRKKKALSGELTPFTSDDEKNAFTFAGSDGDVYTTTLNECTCADFLINLGRQRPCKHMIRMAMELGLYPNDGIVQDHDAANARYYLGILRSFVHNATLIKAVNVIQIIESVGKTGVLIKDNALAFAGVPSLLNSRLFVEKGSKKKLVPSKLAKSGFDGLTRTLIMRLGTLIFDNLSYEPIMTLIKNVSSFEEEQIQDDVT